LQRKQIQPKPQGRSKKIYRKSKTKPHLSLEKLLLNWIIVFLIILILGFGASIIWKYGFATNENLFTQESAVKQNETQRIRVEVLNGCGVKGLASKFTDYLRTQGFDVVITENYQSFDVDSSFVIDRISLKSGNAYRLARSLGISSKLVNAILSDDLAVEASIVLGKDYAKLKGYTDITQ